MFIACILSVLINLILIFVIIKQRKIKHKDNESEILKEILDKASKNELNFIDSSARYIIEVLKKYYRIDYCTIFMKENENNPLEVIASDVDPFYHQEIKNYCTKLIKNKKGVGIINEAKRMYLEYNSAAKRKIRYSYFIELGEIGALYIENKTNYEGNNFELDIFNMIIKNINILLQNCIYQDKISKQAMRDNLTGIYNRNYMNNHIDILKKQNKNISLAIMDIDHFKSVNDTYGHDFGDIVLQEVSKFMKAYIGNMDEIYRWGGEEFILSFPGQNVKDVEYKLNLARESLSKFKIENDSYNINITASFGISEFRANDSLKEVIKRADESLYNSKCNGRNKVTVWVE